MKISQICNNLLQVEMNDLFYLQSYDSIIALYDKSTGCLTLFPKWDFSKTTKNHLFKWLNTTAPEYYDMLSEYKSKTTGIQKLIDSGEIKFSEKVDS